MHSPAEEPVLCARCEERPALKRYARGGLDEMLCAACFERWDVQDAYEGQLVHISDLESAGKYDEAIACLNTILEANSDRDRDGWLARSIAHHVVLVLLDAVRYPEALQACRAWESLGFADVSERWQHATATGHALEGLGRDGEAVAALEDALGYEDPKHLPSVLGVLTELVRLSEKIGQPVDPQWLTIAEAVAERYGVEMPARDSPSEAILALEEITRGKQPKHPSE